MKTLDMLEEASTDEERAFIEEHAWAAGPLIVGDHHVPVRIGFFGGQEGQPRRHVLLEFRYLTQHAHCAIRWDPLSKLPAPRQKRCLEDARAALTLRLKEVLSANAD